LTNLGWCDLTHTLFHQKLLEYQDDRFIQYIQRHQIQSIALDYIEHQCALFDQTVHEKLKCLSREIRMENLKATIGLIELVGLFNTHNIRYMALKGPALSYELYGDIGIRDYQDVDLWISEMDLFTVKSLLSEMGYHNLDSVDSLTIKQKNSFFKAMHHISFQSKNGVLFEIHFRLISDDCKSQYLEFPFESFWANRRVIHYNGSEINVMGEQDQLIFLIFHASKHGFFRMKWLIDLYTIFSQTPINWQSLIERMEQMNSRHLLVQSLLLIDDFFDTTFEKNVSDWIQPTRSEKKIKDLAKAFNLERDVKQFRFCHKNYFRFIRYKLRMIKGLRYRLNYLLFLFRPQNKDFQKVKINDKWFALYYLYRPIHKIIRMFKKK